MAALGLAKMTFDYSCMLAQKLWFDSSAGRSQCFSFTYNIFYRFWDN